MVVFGNMSITKRLVKHSCKRHSADNSKKFKQLQRVFLLNRESNVVMPNSNGSKLLAQIGKSLDQDRGCVVYPSGYVWPITEQAAPHIQPALKEVIQNEARKSPISQRPATGSREGTAGRSPAQGASAPCTAAPVLRELIPDFNGVINDAVKEVLREYPEFHTRSTPTGRWITGVVQPVQDLPFRAHLAVLLPTNVGGKVRAWAWWDNGLWIGPRHTNYDDGSICAFEPTDGSWDWSKKLVTLFDMYAIWLARHLHLIAYGRWPGRQILHTVYERLTEQRAGELCGCGLLEPYSACCREMDLSIGIVSATVNRPAKLIGRKRKPLFPTG